MVGAIDNVSPSLATLVPSLVSRVGTLPLVETCEELRLELLHVTIAVVGKVDPLAGGVFVQDLVAIASCLASDPFPEVKREVCTLVRALQEAQGKALAVHCSPLARALLPNLGHQHSRIRAHTFEAVCTLLSADETGIAELGPQIVSMGQDANPSVRESVVRGVGALLRAVDRPVDYVSSLVPVLLHSLCDEVTSVQSLSLAEIAALGARVHPGADGDAVDASHTPAVDATRGLPSPPLPALFKEAPPWPAVQLVQGHLQSLLVPALRNLKDWTARGRLRAASIVLGAVWLARGVVTDRCDILLSALNGAVDDDDPAIADRVAACALVTGAHAKAEVSLSLCIRLSGSEAFSAAQRAAALRSLALVTQGAPAGALQLHLGGLAAVLCQPQFCAAPVALGEEAGAAHMLMQQRLVGVVEGLLASVGGHQLAVLPGGVAYRLYVALMQLAALPTRADDEYVAQRKALAVIAERLPQACGQGNSAASVHGAFAPRLLDQLIQARPMGEVPDADDKADAIGALVKDGSDVPGGDDCGTPREHGAGAAPLVALMEEDAAKASLKGSMQFPGREGQGATPFAEWTSSTHEWHVFQALCHHAPGEALGRRMAAIFPVLAALLRPSNDPPLRLTGVTVVHRLVSNPSFCAVPDVAEWGVHLLNVLLIPNLVWRAGKAAQHVRFAAARCLDALTAAEPPLVQPREYVEAMPVRPGPGGSREVHAS